MFTAAFRPDNRDYGQQTRAKMRGLASKLSSVQFESGISLMFDILQELSLLSLSLQKKSMTLNHADRLVKRTIRVIASFKDTPGERVAEALTAVERMEFQGVTLSNHTKLVSINKQQFIQSVVDNLGARLMRSRPS
jgi:hypothetical protein